MKYKKYKRFIIVAAIIVNIALLIYAVNVGYRVGFGDGYYKGKQIAELTCGIARMLK